MKLGLYGHYFFTTRKRPRTDFADVVLVYWENGFTQWQDFPNEYFFMFNRERCEKVRLYYAGGIAESNRTMNPYV